MGKFGGRTGTILLAGTKPQAVILDHIWDGREFWFGCQGTDDFRLVIEPELHGNITIIPLSRTAATELVERIQSVLAMQGEALGE